MQPTSAFLPRPADKVLLRAGPHAGKRGTIEVVQSQDRIVVALVEGTSVEIRAEDVRNFSAAARKAWKTTPSRSVGRPAGRSLRRVSVTFRIDSALWQKFRRLETLALIERRSEFLEKVLGEAVGRAEERIR